MLYTPIKLAVAKDQYEKLKSVIVADCKEQKSIPIKIELKNRGEEEHTLLLTRGQIAKVERAKMMGKSTKTIRLSKRQVRANVTHAGGFLGMLAGLVARALPTLAKGLATGLVSGAVAKAISSSGDGLYLFRSGHCIKVDPVKGNGLYLQAHPSLDDERGDGLYLKRGSSVYNGEGLILGKNSPFKNVPILGWIL